MIQALLALVLALPVRAESGFDPRVWMEALTFPDSEWRADDFGTETGVAERELLSRHRPRVFLQPGQTPPVDFYRFYLPKTVVRDRKRGDEVVLRGPGAQDLKRIERRLELYLDYQGPDAPCAGDCAGYEGTAYGRVYRERMTLPGRAKPVPVTVLKYNFAFLYSGLPADNGLVRELGAAIVGDREKWHELDIHGAIHVLLGPDQAPWALLLAQHNHFRSYVFGVDLPAPEDGRPRVCFAARSNEPYPCPEGAKPVEHRTAGDPSKTRWMLLGRARPLAAGRDVVRGPQGGARAFSYKLVFPPSRDPLYVAWLPLGARGRILWRDSWQRTGPPGIDMNTWPELKKYSDIAQFWYLHDGNAEDAEVMQRHMKGFFEVDFAPVLAANGARFAAALRAAGSLP